MKFLYILFLALFLSGCDMAKDMQEMTKNQEALQQLIKKERGWETQVGWNVHNGVLTQVTIVVNAGEVGGETVSTIESVAKDAVAKTFKERPEFLFIQIASSFENQTD